MKKDYYLILISAIISKILCQCLNGEIYSMVNQQCLQCSSSCQQCFNVNEDNCTICPTNAFKSLQNSFKCIQTCLQGQINTEYQQCVQCQVEGCSKCDSKQYCQKCEANLLLSLENNKCFLQKNVCNSNSEFINFPFTKNDCQKMCSSSTYQNFETHQCEQTQQCPQLESSFNNFNQRVIQVNSFLGNQYLIRGNQCYFALVNQNLEIINSQVLQNLNNFEELYMIKGIEVQQKSFILGIYGGCTAGNSLIIMNFITLQTIYSEIGLEQDYYVGYIDIKGQIVFFTCNTCLRIIIFDGISQQVSKISLNLSPTSILFQNQNKQNTTYFIQSQAYLLEIILNTDRSLVVKNSTKNINFDKRSVYQRNDFLISISNSTSNRSINIQKMIFQSDQNITYELIEQLAMFNNSAFYSVNLNSIIEYNYINYGLKISILDKYSDQIIKQFNITSQKLDSISIFENQWDNSTLIFYFQNKILQFFNLTDYLRKKLLNEQATTDSLVNTLDSPFINVNSTITNVILYKDNILDIFLSQVQQINQYYQQQIRLQYNLSNNTFKIKYFSPNQYQKQFYVSNFMVNQNQLMFNIDNDQQNNSFYIFDGYQIYAQQSLRFSKIQLYLQGLQKIPRFNTRKVQYQAQQDFLSYDNLQLISNKYLILSKIINSTVYEYVFMISSQQLLVNYTYQYASLFSNSYYIQKWDMLLVQKVPQIYNLKTKSQYINNQPLYFFSLNNFIILNDDQIVYLTLNDKKINVLYLIDFQLNQIQLLYTFSQNQNPSFWLIYGSIYPYPLIAQSDIIYIYMSSPKCQPFSVKNKQFIYQQVSLQDNFLIYPSINYQQTGEIFIFYQNLIYVYSLDLKQYTLLNIGITYPSLNSNYQPLVYNERFVFYYDQNYFYAFDMKVKQYSLISAFTSFTLYKNSYIDFYRIDGDQNLFIKKSESIIDATNLITIKNQLENNNYLGKIYTNCNTQIHFFQSQNGIYWYLNLLNQPHDVYIITSNQILQDIKLQQNQIAIYDNQTQMLILYNTIKINGRRSIKVDYNFNLKISILNWEPLCFVFIDNKNINIFNEQANQQIQSISQLESNIIMYEYCLQQQIIVVQTQQYNIYTIKINTKQKVLLTSKNAYPAKQNLFYLNCEQNLIIIYYPFIQIYNLSTGVLSANFPQQIVENSQQTIPLVDIQGSLLVIFYKFNFNFFNFRNFQSFSYLFDYKQNVTNLLYDFSYNILIGVTGTLKQINTINIPGSGQLFTYETVSQFSKNVLYLYQEQNILLLVDQTPILYSFNYLKQYVAQYKIEQSNNQGILMDKYKNIIFLYSDFYISAFEYPSMKFIETFTQQYDQTQIQSVFLNTNLSILTVLTINKIITFDLTEVLYASEVNLLQYQNIQSLNVSKELQVYYNIVNLSLNLYKNTQLVDTLLFEPSISNVYPYLTQLIMTNDNSFIYILFEYLNLIKFDVETQKLTLIQKVQLQNLPDNFFYDKIQNQVFILYQQGYQLTSLSLSIQNSIETNLTNFSEGDISQSFIYNQYIIIPSINKIYLFDFIQQKQQQIIFINTVKIQFVFKLQAKSLQNYSDQWWNVPFEYEQRYNTYDSQQQLLICIIAMQNSFFQIFIAQVDTQEIKNSYQMQDGRIINAVNDPFRQLIYVVNNQGQTQVFNYSLSLIKVLQNSCLKQAKISYDSNFIYSICPNDIIIYNGLSFQQQYPVIQSGLKEVTNIVNIQFDNLFIITQKTSSLLVKLNFDFQYQLIEVIDQKNLLLSKFNLNQDSNNNILLEMLFSSYQNTFQYIIPLSKKQACSVEINQQNRPLESIYTQIKLNKTLTSLQSSQQKLATLKIDFLDQQQIQIIDLEIIQWYMLDPNKPLSLIIQSDQILNNIYWSKNQTYSEYITNFQINSMSLNIIDSININKYNQMKNFQMINLILNIENTLNISNFDSVYLQDIKFNNAQNGNNQIIISNNKFVVIENIRIDSIQNEQLTFLLSNNTNLVIKQIYINQLSKNDIFKIQNNQYIDIQNIFVTNSSQITVFQISLCQQLNIKTIYLSSVQSSKLLYLQGIYLIQIEQIKVNQSSQINLVAVEPLYEKNIQYTCLSFSIQAINIVSSQEVKFYIQANNTQISNFLIFQSQISNVCFQISPKNLVIQTFRIKQVQPIINNTSTKIQNNNIIKHTMLQILDFQNCTINNLTSLNNKVTVLSVNQPLDGSGNFQMSFSKFSGFENQLPLIEMNYVDNILFDQVLLESNVLKQNTYQSILYVSQCNNLTINNSRFQNNTNTNGQGGSLYAVDCLNIQLQNSTFKQNTCQQLNGGAISIQNSMNIAQVNIQRCVFIYNSAKFSTGGAVSLQYANLIIKNTNITSNSALIGGGIYYQQIIPDFIFEISKSGNNNNNQIKSNYARFYGNNLGSTVRRIDIDLQNVIIPKESVKFQIDHNVEIREFKSGNKISFEKIQLFDEENNPMKMSNINQTEFQLYSSNVQNLIQSLSVSLNWDQTNKKVQVIGQVQSKQFINNGINLQSQIMYMPKSSMSMQIVLDTLPKLIDSKGNIFFNSDQFQKKFTIYFTECSIGEITIQQIDSIICQMCPEGKYSLDKNTTTCKQCPDSAVECYGSTINLANGYWRENNLTDLIIYCNKNPQFCQAESPDSRFICIPGHIGPLCQSCDQYGQIWGKRYSQVFSSEECYDCSDNAALIFFENALTLLAVFLYIFIILIKILYKMQQKLIGYFLNQSEILFLGSTLRQSDKPQIISKLLTDHLQMLSLLNTFQIDLPNYFKIPVQLFGNSLSITSKSFNCILSQYQITKPLWFYQALISLLLPALIVLFYILLGLLQMIIKKDSNTFKYLRTALIFTYLYFFPMVVNLLSRSINCLKIGDQQYLDLDNTIICMDQKYHKPYIIYFSLPLLIIWTLIIPLLLFYIVRNGKMQKWSIFKEIKYSFVFAGYKDQYYYWEFGKLFYKSLLILICILLQQNQQLKPQFSKFTLQSFSSLKNSKNNQKQLNSLSSLRKKWSYYTRLSKQSPLFKDRIEESPNNKNEEYYNETCQTGKYLINSSKEEIQFTNL
ncbi:hypothetical protein ABPG74_017351 [Tetrahymena malaccensis]